MSLLPLAVLQPLLGRMVNATARRRTELFGRLGRHEAKRYLIDPLNLPFVLLLHPDSRCPHLRAYDRRRIPPYDVRIAGTFLTLLDMIDNRLDGDALFFTRDLIVEGDTEAAVVLRNALDDVEGSIVDDVMCGLGPLAAPSRIALRALRELRGFHYAGSRHTAS